MNKHLKPVHLDRIKCVLGFVQQEKYDIICKKNNKKHNLKLLEINEIEQLLLSAHSKLSKY